MIQTLRIVVPGGPRDPVQERPIVCQFIVIKVFARVVAGAGRGRLRRLYGATLAQYHLGIVHCVVGLVCS